MAHFSPLLTYAEQFIGQKPPNIAFKLEVQRRLCQLSRYAARAAIEVFRLEVYVSCVKYGKNGRTEYLIIAGKEENKYMVEEYKVRWQIETLRADA